MEKRDWSWYKNKVLVDYGNPSYQRSKFNDPNFENVPEIFSDLWKESFYAPDTLEAWKKLYLKFSEHGSFNDWYDYLYPNQKEKASKTNSFFEKLLNIFR